MPLKQTIGNARKFIRDYYGNRLFSERQTVIYDQYWRNNRYLRYRERNRVRKGTILYESTYGCGVVDNPYAIFRALLADDRFSSFVHYWVLDSLDDHADLIRKYKDFKNVRFVGFESEEYLRALATCEYLINNSTFPPYFSKRENQVYVNTWHGTPIKKMGFDLTGGVKGSANVVRNFLSADYLLSANETMSAMYLKSFKMDGLYGGSILEEGYPRVDTALSANRSDVLSGLRLSGFDLDPDKKIVVYAPTWKNASATNDTIDVFSDVDTLVKVKISLEERLGPSYQVLIKPHQFLYAAVKNDPQYENLFIPSYIDTNELLSVADILISDYSSIIFDYLVLDRPILFYVPDSDNYRSSRGFNIDLDELPGPKVTDLNELALWVQDPDKYWREYADKHLSFKDRFTPMDDGKVCNRIIEEVFFSSGTVRKAHVSHDKKRLLLFNGNVSVNGLTRSLVSLLKQIDYDEFDVTVYCKLVNPDLAWVIDEMPDQARILLRIGYLSADTGEDALRATIEGFGKFNPVMRSRYPREVFERESRRCFGISHFDRAIDFNGYEQTMSELLVSTDSDLKVLWLHSDINADMNKTVNGKQPNYWHLNHIISMYPEFDRIVSCGKTVNDINRSNFANADTFDKFIYARNTVDADRIRDGLAADVQTIEGVDYFMEPKLPEEARTSIVRLPRKDLTSFIAVGRYSTEKNFLALIKAFAKLHASYPDTELFIVGDGPLKSDVVNEIRTNQLAGAVQLTGNVSNPFIFMSHSDCFVLCSIHEGQPLSILEARACGLPIITSNFSTVADSLVEDGQYMTGTDEQSIYEGLKAYMEGKVPQTEFSLDEYNRIAYEEFKAAIGC